MTLNVIWQYKYLASIKKQQRFSCKNDQRNGVPVWCDVSYIHSSVNIQTANIHHSTTNLQLLPTFGHLPCYFICNL